MLRSWIVLVVVASSVYAQEESCVRVGTNHIMASGTIVGRDGETCYVLTNKHVVSDADKGKYIWVLHNRKCYAGTFVKTHADVDLSLVAVKLEAKPITLADAEPKEQAELRHFGNATGPQVGKADGFTTFATSEGKVMNADIFSVSGDSGSGMFDTKGRLCGVLRGRVGDINLAPSLTRAMVVRLPHIVEFTKGYAGLKK